MDNHLIRFWEKPYPSRLARAYRKNLVSYGQAGGLVFCCLLVFQPFGLDEIVGSKILTFLGFGLVTFACPALVEALMRRLISERPAMTNMGREFLFLSANVALASQVNLIFASAIGLVPLTPGNSLLYLYFAMALGAIPIVLILLVRTNRTLRGRIAEQEQEPETGLRGATATKVLRIKSAEGNQLHCFPQNAVLFIKAAGNYIEVHYMTGENRKTELIRTSLEKVEQQLIGLQAWFRCHRSYLVNGEQVLTLRGGSRNGRLLMVQTDVEIPVGRSRYPEISRWFHSLEERTPGQEASSPQPVAHSPQAGDRSSQ